MRANSCPASSPTSFASAECTRQHARLTFTSSTALLSGQFAPSWSSPVLRSLRAVLPSVSGITQLCMPWTS
eukprot:6214513-Pleurochrysis_carterae.AAC.2